MKIILAILILFIIICLISWAVDTHRFVTRSYELEDPHIKKTVRFVLLADLHNKDYGDHNGKLIDAVADAEPDAVLIAGDLLDGLAGHDFTVAVDLLRILSDRYPVYYGMGNHEYRLKIYPDQYGSMWKDYTEDLKKMGLHVMDNERTFIPELGIDVAGLSIGREYYKRFSVNELTAEKINEYIGPAGKDACQILIAHDPEYFRAYSEWGADLTVSGHVHGGIMRLPFIGGIVSPRLIRFPRYSGGKYVKNGKTMVVSCGLGTHTLHVRVFNPGELSVITIRPKKNGNI